MKRFNTGFNPDCDIGNGMNAGNITEGANNPNRNRGLNATSTPNPEIVNLALDFS